MLTTKRHAIIIETLNENESVTIQELVTIMDVSESTIRRDLSILEKNHQLIRVHGGATTVGSKKEEPSYQEKRTQQTSSKRKVAQLASQLVKDHEVIYLDAGTTTYEMIPFLKDRDLTVVTNGLMHLDLLEKYEIETYLIGGKVKHKTAAIIGTTALRQLEHYHFDHGFIGTNAVDADFGYSTPDPEEAEIKRQAILASDEAYVVTDQSKLNIRRGSKFAELEEATLIVDRSDDQSIQAIKKKTKVKVAD